MASKNCGECRFYQVTQAREFDQIGTCKLQKLMGVFRSTTAACNSFSLPGDNRLPPPSGGRSSGRMRGGTPASLHFDVASSALAELIGTSSPKDAKDGLAMAFSTRVALPRIRPSLDLGEMVVIKPADEQLQAKEIPAEQFLSKAMSIRDNLRVLEQKFNSSSALSPLRLMSLQASLTRAQAAVLNCFCGVDDKPTKTAGTATAAVFTEVSRAVDWQRLRISAPLLAERWHGGQVLYVGDNGAITESIEQFFRRLVVMRDELLALNAVIMDHPKFEPSEREKLVGYVKRSFGTLTTFNLLFHDRNDYFSSK